ncbi:MAG: D-alanyl-D-alanine carboxypeptidase [Lachnospiraceae bacterium]|nr:D-alanyl-D-alanine carboxypeptidase [Lachnospiraceae bacterium]
MKRNPGIRKRIFAVIIMLAVLVFGQVCGQLESISVKAAENNAADAARGSIFDSNENISADSAQATAEAQEASIDLYAASAVLMDGNSGRVLYNKDGDTPLPMASTTKIMTCILALEFMTDDTETICTVSGTASAQPEVKLGMSTGDTFYLRDLLYSLMLESHNDTAVCIAETVGGSVENFAAMMNAKAAEIGCTQTYYITPNGLDAEDEKGEHHTTAHDLALVMRYCLTQSPKSEEFLAVTQTASYTFSNISGTRTYSCTNHNAFLNLMEGAISGKTGFTGKAGYCYVGALLRDGKLLIVALLACGWPNNKGYKWIDTKKLMNFGLTEFEMRDITAVEISTKDLAVTNGQQESVSTILEEPSSTEVLMRSDDRVEVRVEMLNTIEAPVAEGTQVGLVHYLVDGEEYAVTSILTETGVEERTYLYCLRELVREFLF